MEAHAALAIVTALVAELHGEARPDEALELESLTVVLLVEALEDRHGVVIPARAVTPAAFATLTSLAALAAAHGARGRA